MSRLLEIRVDRIDEMLLDGELLPYWRDGRWVGDAARLSTTQGSRTGHSTSAIDAA